MKLEKILEKVDTLKPDERWALLQALAAPSRFYGDGGTIHRSGELDVEVHAGKVVSVWFRCQLLPFGEHEVEADRAAEMLMAQSEVRGTAITGVHVTDPER